MIRKLALVGVIVAAALSGCATYDRYGYQNGRGDYYSGRPQVSSSVGVSIGTGYGYGYPYGSYGYGGGYGYDGYGYGYGGYPGYYGGGYPYYGRPYQGRPRPHRPRPPRPDSVDSTPDRKPGWRDIENIRNQNRQPTPRSSYAEPTQRSAPRPESRPNRGSFSGQIERARRSNRQPVEP